MKQQCSGFSPCYLSLHHCSIFLVIKGLYSRLQYQGMILTSLPQLVQQAVVPGISFTSLLQLVKQAALPGTQSPITGTAGTTGCSNRDSVSPHCYSWYNRLQYQGLSLTLLLQLEQQAALQGTQSHITARAVISCELSAPQSTHRAYVRHTNWCSSFIGNFWAICPLVRAAEGRFAAYLIQNSDEIEMAVCEWFQINSPVFSVMEFFFYFYFFFPYLRSKDHYK